MRAQALPDAGPTGAAMTALERASGVLLHPTSLPGGRLGRARLRASSTGSPPPASPGGRCSRSARRTSTGSPYASASAFAGWTGLLADPSAPVSAAELERFVAEQPYWIGHWAALRRPRRASRARCASQREWDALRALRGRARRPPRSATCRSTWPTAAPTTSPARALPERRRRRRAARPLQRRRASAGATRSTTGATMRATGYRWWIERFRRTFELVDLTRVDHFRGFVAYWAVPARPRTARQGVWRRAPGPRAVRDRRAASSAGCR